MKKQTVYLLGICCLLACSFAACGRNDGDSNNNSVTDGTYRQDTITPLPTRTPTVNPDDDNHTPDNMGDGILDGIEDVGDGVIDGVGDVIDGVGDAVNDVGDGITGENRHDDNAGNNNTR